jgi:undecaprenyl pyrophosphate synthase
MNNFLLWHISYAELAVTPTLWLAGNRFPNQ